MSRGRYVDPTILRTIDHTETFTDGANPTDNFESLIDNGIELVGLTDAVTFYRIMSLTEAIGPIETRALEFQLHVPDETLGLTDVLSRVFKRPAADDLGLTDAVTFRRILGRSETLNIVDINSVNTNLIFPEMGYSRPFSYDVGWRDVINQVDITVEGRIPQFENTVWDSPSIYNIPIGGQIVLKALSSDPFFNAITPVAGRRVYSDLEQKISPNIYDFILDSGEVLVTLSRTSGQATDIIINNVGANVATIAGIRLRANPVISIRAEKILLTDTNSLELNGLKSFTDSLPWANANDSNAVSEVLLKQRFKRLPVVHFTLNNGNDVRLREILEVKLSDRIHLEETETFTDSDFFVEQVSHNIEEAGNYHRTVIGCEQIPVPVEGGFTFDDEVLGKFDTGKFGDRSNTFNFEGGRLFILGQSTLNGDEVLGL